MTVSRYGRCLVAVAVVLASTSAFQAARADDAGQQRGPRSFTSSFESGAKPPKESVVEADGGKPIRRNVTAPVATYPGSVNDQVVAITGDPKSSTGESPANLADDDSSTKWLTGAKTGWVAYELSKPVVVKRYKVVSANDFAGRDPKDWTLQGSTDGKEWVDLDTRTNQSFSERLQAKDLTVEGAKAFSHYRLDVTKNSGEDGTQLADWVLSTGESAPSDGPMVTAVGSGPTSGPTSKANAGFTGVRSLRYAGQSVARGRAYETNRLFDVHIPVDRQTRLSYRIFPELLGKDLTYPATNTAIDLHFTDGTYLSDLRAVDQHDSSLTPTGQGRAKILYSAQWNHVQSDIGDVAAGKTIDRILLAYDNPGAQAKQAFRGWVDDLSVGRADSRIDSSSLTNYVDTRRGTNANGSFSRGNNLPITAVPNGFNFLTPATDATSSRWEYEYQKANNADNLPELQGLTFSHQPSPWMGDRDQLTFMPVAQKEAVGDPKERAAAFSHDDETAKPDYYGVKLANGVKAEMTPTDHGGVFRFAFPAGAAGKHLVVDTIDEHGSFTLKGRTLTGWVENGSDDGRTRMFVYGTLDTTPTAFGAAPRGRSNTRGITFGTGTKSVTLKVATSFIGTAQAKKNLGLEIGGKSFSAVRDAARRAWDKKLSVVSVKGASDTKLRTLYSNLYRLNLYPNSQSENTGTAAKPVFEYASPVQETDGEPTATTTNAKVVPGKIYVNNGFWDTYRTVWPAYSLLYPKMAAEIADGFVQQYRDGGWIARWSAPGYADLMTGTSSDVAIADAYVKGVKLPDPLAAYDAAVKNATVAPPSSAVGRKGIEKGLFLGYTPNDTHESVSWALEGFVNDFGIANMAAKLVKDPATPKARRAELREQSAYFRERAQNYVQMFDPKVKFFQGRKADGTFGQSPKEFDPETWGGDFTETNGWNFAFHAPQDGQGLANLYGGRGKLERKLDTFFDTPEQADKPGGYGGVIHEMLEARDVRMGQFGMSNQVSHHIPYMYDYTGAPHKTQAAVREVMRRLYVGDEIGQGYPGDEDNGEMSSWYLLSMLGIYPLQVGSDQYAIGSPLFKKATVHLGGKKLVVNAENNSPKNVYVQSLKVNGKKHSSTSLSQSAIGTGGRLDFVMGPKPSTWGTKKNDVLPSITSGNKVPTPLADATRGGAAGAGTTGAATKELFDDDSTTQVGLVTETPVSWMFDKRRKVSYYTLTSAEQDGDPTAWRLEGSNDGRTWTTLDRRDGQEFAWRRQTRPFAVRDAGSYERYRLVVTASDGTPRLSEVELLSKGGR